MRVASFDIGIYNTAVYIEDFDSEKLEAVKNMPKKFRYSPSGEPTTDFQKILDAVYLNGRCVYMGKMDFIGNVKKKYIDKQSLDCITKVVSDLEILSTCDFILIEKQLDINKKAKRIENHIHSILNYMFPNIECVIYNASNKTQVLGAPKKVKNKKGELKRMTKPERKKWACKEAKYIINIRGDTVLYEYLFRQSKKPDDESDCICQLQSAKYKFFVEKISRPIFKEDRVSNTISRHKYTRDDDGMVKCGRDHIFSLKNSVECKECLVIDKKTRAGGIIGEKGGSCFNYSSDPIKIMCGRNHEFWESVDNIELGAWCKEC